GEIARLDRGRVGFGRRRGRGRRRRIGRRLGDIVRFGLLAAGDGERREGDESELGHARRIEAALDRAKRRYGWKTGAGEGIRTLDPNLGKVVLYPGATPALGETGGAGPGKAAAASTHLAAGQAPPAHSPPRLGRPPRLPT